jgi:hypothetical protein
LIEAGTCGAEAVNNGATYQQLSNDTNGLRFPLCDNDNFDAIFSTIADDVVAGTTLPCTFTPVDTGNGFPDPDKSAMIYTPGDGSPIETLTEVDQADCIDGAYFVDGTDFTLCPATCDRVRLDEAGKVQLAIGCLIVVD